MVSCGIVGLPNVGKSTLLNALTHLRQGYGGQAKQAAVGNFPFTTVDPNIGVVAVPDERLEKLAALSRSGKVVPTTIEFVDIAGLVKGAHAGEGLGNQFLAHIREVDAIVQVVRFFPDPNVLHVGGNVSPADDAETINTELALADLQATEKMIEQATRQAKSGDPALVVRAAVLAKFRDVLADGHPARTVVLHDREREAAKDLALLTRKPILYVANLDEEQMRRAAENIAAFAERYHPVVPLSVKIEQELTELSSGEGSAFLAEYGLGHSGLVDLISEAYALLGLITFLTTGPKETRAWTVRNGATAPEAAGEIHSDFEREFIRAETIAWDRLVAAGSYATAREQGLVRDEGKAYVVRDGDVFVFKTGA